MGTMFSQLVKRSTRMLVSVILKPLRTFVVYPDVLENLRQIHHVRNAMFIIS